MISILLTILKIIGIILLVLLGVLLTAVLLVLFVPVRYGLHAHRDLQEEAPVVARVKVTWLLHLISVYFSYPDAAYVRAKILGITVYRSDKEKKSGKKERSRTKGNTETKENTETKGNAETKESAEIKESAETKGNAEIKENTEIKGNTETKENTENKKEEQQENEQPKRAAAEQKEATAQKETAVQKETPELKEEAAQKDAEEEEEEKPAIKQFLLKLVEKLKNIKYTIRQICDKIKHIVRNIRYYFHVIRSETFKRAFSLCKKQVFSLLKSILPKKIKGKLLIGTGDPASTGQVLAVYGMLYPLIGDNIVITPDFEQQIIEGELQVKGRITVGRLLKVAIVVFFNKDIRRVIKLLKREVK